MGRLFWKIFLGFWLALLVIGAGVGFAVHLNSQDRLARMTEVAVSPRAEMAVAAVATALRHGGEAAAKAVFEEWPGPRPLPVLVVNANGRDLLGRPVPEAALARASGAGPAPGLRRVRTPEGGDYLLFVPAEFAAGPRPHRRVERPPEPLAVRLLSMFVASLLFSAGLAWYLTRPVRHLREATRRLAGGALDTRVAARMGGRRDEIADLGRDFDYMADRLQALVGAQKRLLHDVSHELRSPLARLQVAAALARQQPDHVAAMLDRIEHEVERLDELVGETLTLSRLEAGVSGVRDEPLDLVGMLESVAEDARFEAEAGGKRVELDATGDTAIEGRGELLRRAVENVVRNAVRYTAPDSAVHILLRRDADGQIMISVCDAGGGVPAQDLGKLFDPFFQAGDGGRDGFGLGLAIARRAVEAHGGTIRAHNRPEGGLCVEIRLPRRAAS